MRADRPGALVASIVALLTLVGCSASPVAPAAGTDPIRIGVITICEGTFAENQDAALAGAELPFIQRGARLIGTVPQEGVTSVSVGGRPVELVSACERYGDRSTTISALSSLVERSRADIVVGPLWQGDSIAVREYARYHPDVTFIATGNEQSATLRRPVPNQYRFDPDAEQWNAALGTYARRTLGWKSAATLSEGDPTGWQVAGFVAGFCSIGGRIAMADRLFTDKSLAVDPGPLVAKIPSTVDGLFLTGITGGGPKFGGTGRAVPRWRQTHPLLRQHLLIGWGLLYPPDPALRGVVGASPDPFRSTPAWDAYNTAFAQAFPGLQDPYYFNQPYYDGVEPVLQALRQVNGDLSEGQRRFAAALAHLRYHSPEGLITLDRRHQAIAPIYLGRVAGPGADAPVVQIGVVKHVHETLGGYFSPTSPPPSATQPACRSVPSRTRSGSGSTT
jgi:branched-chain amino acid transport system substrate-binding protein